MEEYKVYEEEFLQVNLWCRPLGRSTYRFADMKKGVAKNLGKATGTLFREFEAKEKAASGVLVPKEPVLNQNGDVDYEAEEERREIAEARARLESNKEDFASMPRLKRLKARIDSRVFDYSEIEREKIEEEIANLVNKDGYYDEIEPMDADENYKEEFKVNPFLIGLFVALFVTVGLFIYIISTF